MFSYMCWTCQNDRRTAVPEYFSINQLPGIFIEEELAER
jgi:hypothetical protein